MNDQQFDQYLETLQYQLDKLQIALKNHIILEGDLPMIAQLHEQGWIPASMRVRLEMVVGSLVAALHMSATVEQNIKEYLNERKRHTDEECPVHNPSGPDDKQ